MRLHICDRCGWETKTPDNVRVVFHPCQGIGERRRLIDWLSEPSLAEELHDERAASFTHNYPRPAPEEATE